VASKTSWHSRKQQILPQRKIMPNRLNPCDYYTYFLV
jgi:hypothetical protein